MNMFRNVIIYEHIFIEQNEKQFVTIIILQVEMIIYIRVFNVYGTYKFVMRGHKR